MGRKLPYVFIIKLLIGKRQKQSLIMKHFNKIYAFLLPLVILLGASMSSFAQLNGTYTVYGAGANYANLQAAASALTYGAEIEQLTSEPLASSQYNENIKLSGISQ